MHLLMKRGLKNKKKMKRRRYEMLKQIKKTLGILLLVCFLMSVTAVAVSAGPVMVKDKKTVIVVVKDEKTTIFKHPHSHTYGSACRLHGHHHYGGSACHTCSHGNCCNGISCHPCNSNGETVCPCHTCSHGQCCNGVSCHPCSSAGETVCEN
jgi:hypothetical protein